MVSCPICSYECNKQINATCMFYGSVLTRYVCEGCGLIFGPIDTIKLSTEELGKKYIEVYSSGYKDYDCTDVELDTLLHWLGAKPGFKYLNWGAGVTRTAAEAKKYGVDLEEYDLWLPVNLQRPTFRSYNNIINTKYDGIISNNWLEHSQNPIRDLKLQLSLLNNNSYIIHRTPCYQYVYERSPFHLFFYTGNSIKKLAEVCNANFNIINDQMISFWPKK